MADVLTKYGEVIDTSKPYTIFDPEHTWKKLTLTDFEAKPLLKLIFDKGKCVYETPDLKTIQEKCREEVKTLWDEVVRFENPHRYYVDLSKDLWQMKQNLLDQFG